ncbi:MAG: response regulator receiver modulated metal dependent phosphohydrolase, partial [Solirubrobacterales bacterium]|nr:response regulator receiver modulated metal dependent phosphohydrolase [Solirubrobacterales bacterium]
MIWAVASAAPIPVVLLAGAEADAARATGAVLRLLAAVPDRPQRLAGRHPDATMLEHTASVASCSVAIGRELGLSEAELEVLQEAAPLHDIGKIGVADAILLKPGPLTAQERRAVERHTLIGAAILRGGTSPVRAMAEEIALNHHERWDGQGYPNGLAASAIPLAARIVAVADVFDALTHERSYKAAWPVDRAVAYVIEQSGSHFDPTVVTAFSALHRRGLPAAAAGRSALPTAARRSTDTQSPAPWRPYGDALRAGEPVRAQQAVAAALAGGLSVTAVHDRIIAP